MRRSQFLPIFVTLALRAAMVVFVVSFAAAVFLRGYDLVLAARPVPAHSDPF